MAVNWENDESNNARDLIRWESVCLWGDLHDAKRHAINGGWSMGCDSIVARILMFARVVGHVPWKFVPIALLADGTYSKVYETILSEEVMDQIKVAEKELAR
jgi:hypothetical protein